MGPRDPKEGDHPMAEEVYEYVDLPSDGDEAVGSEAADEEKSEEESE